MIPHYLLHKEGLYPIKRHSHLCVLLKYTLLANELVVRVRLDMFHDNTSQVGGTGGV